MDVLEDYDFEMAPQFLDMPPGQAAELKSNLNIDDDYFVAVVDDPTPEQLVEIRQELEATLRPT
jgi:hypothetical protein